jgi:hypothetical protein
VETHRRSAKNGLTIAPGASHAQLVALPLPRVHWYAL